MLTYVRPCRAVFLPACHVTAPPHLPTAPPPLSDESSSSSSVSPTHLLVSLFNLSHVGFANIFSNSVVHHTILLLLCFEKRKDTYGRILGRCGFQSSQMSPPFNWRVYSIDISCNYWGGSIYARHFTLCVLCSTGIFVHLILLYCIMYSKRVFSSTPRFFLFVGFFKPLWAIFWVVARRIAMPMLLYHNLL